MKTYTDKIRSISKELGVSFSVAMDIEHLREYERRIVAASKAFPSIEDFEVLNADLETQLEPLEFLTEES